MRFWSGRSRRREKAYAAIDGRHIHQYVEDLTAISRKYRDSGHPQFWGRIIGTQADADTAQWMVDKFKKFGLSDVRIQPFELPPQWMPQSWEITAAGGGKTLHLDSAQPAYQTKSTDGLDLEAAYVGTGSEADFAGRDVRGKAVFIFSMPLPGSWRHTAMAEGAVRRAEEKGAAAIFAIIALPGNVRTQLYPTRTNVPTFSLGMDDGYAVRDLIGEAPAGQAPHVKIRLDVKMEEGLKTGTVWGTLPGATDETIRRAGASRRLVRSGNRQRVGRRDHGGAGGVLRENSRKRSAAVPWCSSEPPAITTAGT